MTASRHIRMVATAVFCALALWAYLETKLSTERTVAAIVEIAAPDGLDVRLVDADEIEVVMRGRPKRMAPPVFAVDARGWAAGEYEVLLERGRFDPPGGATVISVSRDTLRFALE